MREHGYNVQVICLKSNETPSHEIIQGIEVYRISILSKKLHSIFSFIKYLEFFFRVQKYLKKADLVHVNDFEPLPIVWFARMSGGNFKTLYDAHEFASERNGLNKVFRQLIRSTEKFFGGFSYKFLRKLLAFSLPLVPSGLAVFFSAYLDRFMINKIIGIEAVGVYGVGFRIASLVGILTIGLRGAFMPTIYKYAQDKNTPKKVATAFRLFAVGALSFSSIIILFPEFFLEILSTEDYISASSVVPSLVLGIIFAQMYIFTPGMALAKKTGLILIINLVAVTLNFILNFLLIPKFGMLGASFATLCSGAILLS